MSALPLELAHHLESNAIIEQLEQLGKLPADTDPAPLMQLAQHSHPKVRTAAAKNLAKLENLSLLPFLVECAQKEPNTMARREFVSAIGRLRHPSVIPHLITFLQDEDPKVVLQAIRGLLCFRQNTEVLAHLQSLRHHPNELIRKAIITELEGRRAEQDSKQNHVHSPEWLHNVLVNADVLDVLGHVPDESIHLTFTSPILQCTGLYHLPQLRGISAISSTGVYRGAPYYQGRAFLCIEHIARSRTTYEQAALQHTLSDPL